VPRVVRFEPWGALGAELRRRAVSLARAAGYRAHAVTPRLLAGRWLSPRDSAPCVITQAIQRGGPDAAARRSLPLRVQGRPMAPRIVGVGRELMPARLRTRRPGWCAPR
jgi:hypothetical protein